MEVAAAMATRAPCSLSPEVLARRLAELIADERGALVEFLLHLEEFDHRRAWAEAGYDSLWTYCQRVLHLREGPAGRRIAAMRIVRRFPPLADALRDGRLCLSTVTLLAPLLTQERLDDLVGRAAYGTKAEVEHLVASLVPHEAPKDGIRRLPDRRDSGSAPSISVTSTEVCAPAAALAPGHPEEVPQPPRASPPLAARLAQSRATVTPVAADTFSLRVTVDAVLKADIAELTALLSHKVPNGDLAAVLREAVHCAIEKHGRRKGARAPARQRACAQERSDARRPTQSVEAAAATDAVPAAMDAAQASPSQTGSCDAAHGPRHRPPIPAHIRREVWKRDGARCTWIGPDGRRCASRWRLELDHIDSFALCGGAVTPDRLRLLCRVHNQLHAEQVFGTDYMARFRRQTQVRVTAAFAGPVPP